MNVSLEFKTVLTSCHRILSGFNLWEQSNYGQSPFQITGEFIEVEGKGIKGWATRLKSRPLAMISQRMDLQFVG